jgi:hypothetical protein
MDLTLATIRYLRLTVCVSIQQFAQLTAFLSDVHCTVGTGKQLTPEQSGHVLIIKGQSSTE